MSLFQCKFKFWTWWWDFHTYFKIPCSIVDKLEVMKCFLQLRFGLGNVKIFIIHVNIVVHCNYYSVILFIFFRFLSIFLQKKFIRTYLYGRYKWACVEYNVFVFSLLISLILVLLELLTALKTIVNFYYYLLNLFENFQLFLFWQNRHLKLSFSAVFLTSAILLIILKGNKNTRISGAVYNDAHYIITYNL